MPRYMLEVDAIAKVFPVPRKSRPNDPASADPRHRGGAFHAVGELSFAAPAGAIVGLLGDNGAGKTTLLRMLSTALTPTRGSARIDGLDVVRDARAVRKRIGFLSGSTGIYGRLTPREMVSYYGALHGMDASAVRARVAALFAALDIESYADRRNDSLSTGMKQKVSIARTLVHDPAVVIFDEPTTGLDVSAAETVVEILARCRDEGKTVLFSTHHMHEVERLCDHVVVLSRGALRFEGSCQELRARTGEDALDRAFLQVIDRERAPAGARDGDRGGAQLGDQERA